MNNLKHIFFASMLMASMTAAAQETYQDAKLAAPQLTGTARYVGMGGAMEALGADISTISSNPAGIGLFRKSQITLTAGVIAQTDAENYTEYNDARITFNGKRVILPSTRLVLYGVRKQRCQLVESGFQLS